MKNLYHHLLAIFRILWSLPIRFNNMAREIRILHRRMDWYAGSSSRITRRKLHRMLTNPRSPFYYTNPRSPIYLGKASTYGGLT